MLDDQAKHWNGVPPLTQIVHGIYSSRSTILRMCGHWNIFSIITENVTSQPQENMPGDISWKIKYLINIQIIIINNYTTSIAPISSKWIEFSGVPSTGVWQTHSPGTMQSSSAMIRWKENFGRVSESEKVSFQMVTERNYATWWLNMFREWISKSRGSNWKSTSPSMSLTLETDNKWKPDERSSLGLDAKESMGQNGEAEETLWQP